MERVAVCAMRNLKPLRLNGRLTRLSSSLNPRIYTPRELFELRLTEMENRNPDKYAFASDFLNARMKAGKRLKVRQVTPSPSEKRMLVLTGIYKREKDIPELVSELQIANAKERVNFVKAGLIGISFIISLMLSFYMISLSKTIVEGGYKR